MTYATLSVVIDGAVDEEDDYFDQTLLDDRLWNIAEESQAHGYHTAVYVLYHDHDRSVVDCECVQYLQDHHPLAEYNVSRHEHTAEFHWQCDVRDLVESWTGHLTSEQNDRLFALLRRFPKGGAS